MKSSNRIHPSRVVEIFRKTTILLFCLVTYGMKGSASLPSPTDSLMRFVKDIYTYNRMFPREQVYLHFDNTGYFMGEIQKILETDKFQPKYSLFHHYFNTFAANLNPLGCSGNLYSAQKRQNGEANNTGGRDAKAWKEQE